MRRVLLSIVLAGCSTNAGIQYQPNYGAVPATDVRADAPGSEKLLYSFGGLPLQDGQEPDGALIEDSTGAFYGTTLVGGLRGAYCGLGGCGIVFKVAPSGSRYTETVVYRFHGPSRLGNDGASPIGSLARDANGVLYGVTYGGGSVRSQGTVFALAPSPSGYSETLLHVFPASARDGSLPCAGLTLGKSGVLFGTTAAGGAYGAGTVFKLAPSTSGYSETILHSFSGGDGVGPQATLVVDKQGTMYGTTTGDGSNCGGVANHGTVFALSPSGSGYIFRTLYQFQKKTDGEGPDSSVLLGKNGALYGTTEVGGSHGVGTVFELTPNGTGYDFRSLYAFRGRSDGIGPYGVVAGPLGSLYGVATSGGASFPGCRVGCGLVFKLKPSGQDYIESTVYSFRSALDGQHPNASLLASSGALYGTTMFGGAGQFAYAGAVFKVVP